MPRRGARRLSLAAVPAVAALLLPFPAAHAQQDTGLADLPLEVSVERGPTRLLVVRTRDSLVLLPTRQFLDFLEVRITDAMTGHRLSGVLPGRVPFSLDTDSGRTTRGREIRALSAGAARWVQHELYVAVADLAWLLAVDLRMDWNELTLRVGAADSLPVVQRLARQRRRDALLRPPPAAAAVPVLPARPRFADGLVVDWAVTGSTSRDTAGEVSAEFNTLQLGLGAEVLGGDLAVQHTRQRAVGRTLGDTRWTWTGVWPERAWLRQLRLGEVFAGGPRGRSVRGAVATNSPFIRPAEFGAEVLAGRLLPGWEVELYRGDQLVGFAPVDAGGRYALDLPVIYGPNPLELVAYGPRGEVIRSGRTFQVPFDRLPAGRFEYSTGGGECQAGDRCDQALNVDVRYGLTRRLTVQAGYDRLWRDTVADLDHPYALASFALTRPLSLTVEGVAHALARGRLDYDPHTDLHLDVTHTWFDTTVSAPIFSQTTVKRLTAGTGFWRPAALGGEVFFQGAYQQAEGAGRRRAVGRLSATARFLGARLSALGEEEKDRAEGDEEARRFGLEAAGDAILGGFGPLRGMLVRVAVRGECQGRALSCDPEPVRGAVGLGRQLLGAVRLDVGLRKERGVPGVGLDVGLTTTWTGARLASRNSYTRDFGLTGVQLLEGSVILDRRSRRVRVDNGRSLGRAGIAGMVFLDLNADGQKDPDEPALPGIMLRVGSDAVVSDSSGRFAVWDLVPFDATPVEVDTLSLENPLLVPAVVARRVRPSPNSFRMVEVAIQQGAEVSGRAVFGDSDVPLGGARLLFTDVTTGAARAVTTFGDGTFYAFGFRPGVYEVSLPATLAAELRAQAAPVRFTVGGWGGTMRIENLVVRVDRLE